MCVVGSMRGNEFQQAYIGSQLVKHLKELEAAGQLIPGKQVMVIPSVNPTSMNLASRFWPVDNTDINRMFPGYNLGETTQRIAAGVFEVVNKFSSGVQLTSFYMPGDFSPHVRMMRTGFENTEKARNFGMPYIMVREPRPYDTTTLNYNWQIWETNAYSLYSRTSGHLDPESAAAVIAAIDRYLIADGVLKGQVQNVSPSRVIEYDSLLSLRVETAGLYYPLVQAMDHVSKGQKLARVIHPLNGETVETLTAPVDGEIFFQHGNPIIYQQTSAMKILPDEVCK